MLQFLFTPVLNASDEIVLIPLAQTEDLATQLEKIAADFGIAAENLKADFKADKKEIFSTYTPRLARKLFLVGLGKATKNFPEIIAQALRTWAYKHKTQVGVSICIDLSIYTQIPADMLAVIEAIALGCYWGTHYEISPLKKPATDKKSPFQIVHFIVEAPERSNEVIYRAFTTWQAQARTMNMINLPPNHFKPADFAKEAIEIAQNSPNTTVKILKGTEVKEAGLEALWAVSKGSAEEPHFCIVEYKPEKAQKKIALVGKGITYDSGGLNIKTQGMLYMKSDMGGGATVLGAIQLVAQLQLPLHIIAIVPTCENMISGNSYKASDIIQSYAGISIEVEDTDAEGRLILADGLAYTVRNFQPDVLVDVATLTGASIVALGTKAGAMMTKNEELAQKLYEIGLEIDEKVWRMPLWDEYADQIKTDLADVKNYGGPGAGCITAGKFLEKFTDNHAAFVHLDVAGMVYGDTEFAKSRVATAFGVRLLAELAKSFVE
jgi:leucyl aminopeptidase